MKAYKLFKLDKNNFHKREKYFLNIKDAMSELNKMLVDECRFSKPTRDEILMKIGECALDNDIYNIPNKYEIVKNIENKYMDIDSSFFELSQNERRDKINSIIFKKMSEESLKIEPIIDDRGTILGFNPVESNLDVKYRNYYYVRGANKKRRVVFDEYCVESIYINEDDSQENNDEHARIFKLCRYNSFNQMDIEMYYTSIKDAICGLEDAVKYETETHKAPSVEDVVNYVNYNFGNSKVIQKHKSLVGFKPVSDGVIYDYRNFYYIVDKKNKLNLDFSEYVIKKIYIKN